MDFRKANLEDIDMLVTTRIEVLRAANGLDAGVDMSEVDAVLVPDFLIVEPSARCTMTNILSTYRI